MTPAQVVQQYQTLIVGAVGFTGVILTLYANARLARHQREQQIEHERRVLRSALRAELQANVEAYEDRIEILKAETTYKGAFVPLNTVTAVYGSAIAKIGLLSESQIPPVLTAYLLIQQMPERVTMLADPNTQSQAGHTFVLKDRFPAIAQMHEGYLLKIREAIAALSGRT